MLYHKSEEIVLLELSFLFVFLVWAKRSEQSIDEQQARVFTPYQAFRTRRRNSPRLVDRPSQDFDSNPQPVRGQDLKRLCLCSNNPYNVLLALQSLSLAVLPSRKFLATKIKNLKLRLKMTDVFILHKISRRNFGRLVDTSEAMNVGKSAARQQGVQLCFLRLRFAAILSPILNAALKQCFRIRLEP